jgi:hypothetical protein
MIIIHVTTYIFVLLLFLLNRLFVVKVWVLYYFYNFGVVSWYGAVVVCAHFVSVVLL